MIAYILICSTGSHNDELAFLLLPLCLRVSRSIKLSDGTNLTLKKDDILETFILQVKVNFSFDCFIHKVRNLYKIKQLIIFL